MTELPERPGARTYTLVLVTLIFWGSAFAAVRFGLVSPGNSNGYHPGSLALLRFFVAALIALGYLVFTKQGLPRRQDLSRIASAGLAGITVYHIFFNFGEQAVASGASAVLIGFSPIFVAILSTIFLKERLSVKGWLGIICSLVGVSLVGMSTATNFQVDIHALALLGSALATAIMAVLSKSLLTHYSGMQLTSYIIIAGVVPLFIFTPELLYDISVASVGATSAVVYLGIFPGFLAYGLWTVALSRLHASRLSVFLNITPLVAALIAWLWLGEVPGSLIIGGGIIAIAGVLIVQLFGEKRAK